MHDPQVPDEGKPRPRAGTFATAGTVATAVAADGDASLSVSIALAAFACVATHLLVFDPMWRALGPSSHHHASREADVGTGPRAPDASAARARPRFSTLSTTGGVSLASLTGEGARIDKSRPKLRGWSALVALPSHRRASAPRSDAPGAQAAAECVGWKHSGGCRWNGPREQDRDVGCAAPVAAAGASGFCECRGGRIASPLSCAAAAEGAPATADAVTGFTCRDACDSAALRERIAAFAARAAVTEQSRRALTERHRRRLARLADAAAPGTIEAAMAQRAAELRSPASTRAPAPSRRRGPTGTPAREAIVRRGPRRAALCGGGFVPTDPPKCGSVGSALARWRASPALNATATFTLPCAAPIPPGVSGVCFCSGGVIAAVACDSRGALSCDDACAAPRRGVAVYVSPLAGAAVGLGARSDFDAVHRLTPEALERRELRRRNVRLLLLESHAAVGGAWAAAQATVAPTRAGAPAAGSALGGSGTSNSGEAASVSADGRGVAGDGADEAAPDLAHISGDVERCAAERARLLRIVRREALAEVASVSAGLLHPPSPRHGLLSGRVDGAVGDSPEGAAGSGDGVALVDLVVGGGHAGRRVDAAFEAYVSERVHSALAEKRRPAP
jgi:hypothetical protein